MSTTGDLQFVKRRGFPGIVQPDDDNFDLLIAEEKPPDARKNQPLWTGVRRLLLGVWMIGTHHGSVGLAGLGQ